MNTSLKLFFTGQVFEECLFKYPKGPFLEIGCGRLPVMPELLSLLGAVDCLDIDREAILFCQKQIGHDEDAHFFAADILDFAAKEKYSIILDGHLLHCLGSIADYKRALKNIFNSLKHEGLFMIETMISHSTMKFEHGFRFDEQEQVLYKGNFKSRLILSSLQIENFFLECGFEVKSLKVCENLRMIPHDKREEAHHEDPQIMRLIASKPRNI